MQEHTNTQGNVEGTTQGQGCAVSPRPHHDIADDCEASREGKGITGRELHRIACYAAQKFVPGAHVAHYAGATKNVNDAVAEVISVKYIDPIASALENANRQLVDAKETIRRVATLIGPQMFNPNRLQTTEDYHQELVLHLTAKIGGFLSAMESYDWMANELNMVRSIAHPPQSVAENAAAVVREFKNVVRDRDTWGDRAEREERVRHDREEVLCEFIKQFGYGGPAQFSPMFEFLADLTNSWAAELNQRRAQFNVMSGKLGFDIGVVPSWGELEEAIDNLKNLAGNPITPPPTENGLFTAKGLHDLFANYIGKYKRPFEDKSDEIKDAWHSLAHDINTAALQDRARVARDAHKSEIEALLEAINDSNKRWDALAKLNGLGEFQSFHVIATHVEEKLKANTEEIIRLSVLDNDKRAIFVRIALAIGLDSTASPDTILARVTGMQAELEALRARYAADEHGGEH